MKKNSELSCWILTEGIAGTENQCLGLAEALNLTPVIKRVSLRAPWKWLSPPLLNGGLSATTDTSDDLSAPWPDILIASGRKSIAPAIAIKKASQNKTTLIQIQDPRCHPKHFDLVALPSHDITRGDNVIVTAGSLHRVTHEKCQEAVKDFPNLAQMPKPHIAVMIGGTSKAHQMTPEITEKLCRDLKKAQKEIGGTLLITASRRTGDDNAKTLKEAFSNHENAYLWDGTGNNPYFAYLGLADYLLVTNDSVSMTSEAISTGKPVYSIQLEGGGKRLDQFHQNLQDAGYTRIFNGALENFEYEAPNDVLKVAKSVQKLINKKNSNS